MELKDIRRMLGGFTASRVLMTSVNLGIYEHLKTPATSAMAAKKAGCDGRATAILLDALASLGLVIKKDGLYRNAPVAAKYLLEESPSYQGFIIKHGDMRWRKWSELDKVVRTGQSMGISEDRHTFILGMHNIASLIAPKVLAAIGLRGVKSALDLGGGPGTYSMEMARRGIKTTLFDRPDTMPIAKPLIRKHGVKGIRFMAGDYHKDNIGRGYDLILLSQILHGYSEADNRAMINKCHAALSPGGRLAIHEFPIDRTLTSPPESALFSVNMLVFTEGGRCYAPEEMSGWLKDAGFVNIKVKRLKETLLVIGSVPRR